MGRGWRGLVFFGWLLCCPPAALAFDAEVVADTEELYEVLCRIERPVPQELSQRDVEEAVLTEVRRQAASAAGQYVDSATTTHSGKVTGEQVVVIAAALVQTEVTERRVRLDAQQNLVLELCVRARVDRRDLRRRIDHYLSEQAAASELREENRRLQQQVSDLKAAAAKRTHAKTHFAEQVASRSAPPPASVSPYTLPLHFSQALPTSERQAALQSLLRSFNPGYATTPSFNPSYAATPSFNSPDFDTWWARERARPWQIDPERARALGLPANFSPATNTLPALWRSAWR